MDNFYLTAIVREIAPQLEDRTFVSASASGSELRLDFRLPHRRILQVSVDRSWPAVFLSERSQKKERRESASSATFAALLNRHLTSLKLLLIIKPPDDRIIRLQFESGADQPGQNGLQLELDLRGTRSNIYLYDAQGVSVASMYPVDRSAQLGPDVPSHSEKTLSESGTAGKAVETTERHLSGSLRAELEARSSVMPPEKALSSLIFDLEEREPEPSVYSRYPIEEAGHRLVDLHADLLLSHIDLLHARQIQRFRFETLSRAAEAYWDAYHRARDFNNSFRRFRQTLMREIAKRTNILHALEADRNRFEEPERLRRTGELLLANINSARIVGDMAIVVDYFDSRQPQIEIELPTGASLQQAAADYFARYQKANRALVAIDSRRKGVEASVAALTEQLTLLDAQPTEQRMAEVASAAARLGVVSDTGRKEGGVSSRRKRASDLPGRRFRSSDGYEILVGRNDRENEAITFKVARSHDVWLHAADYPGSHVIIRNHSRGEVPHRTIMEAAELAALNSKANRAQKVAVHYTSRKFVSKPPRARPGLVRLSSFKTLMVEPRCRIEKI